MYKSKGWLNPSQDRAKEMRRRIELYKHAEKNKRLQRMIMDYASRNPLWWISTFVWTYDPRVDELVEPSTMPFVVYDFQEEIVLLFLGEPGYRRGDGSLFPMLIDKSRIMGLSWIAVASMAYGLLFRSVTYGIMTRKGAELDSSSPSSLMGKLDFLFDRLPPWMLDKEELVAGRRKSNPHQFVYRGSFIEGDLTTEDAFRGQRHTRTVIDEGASVPKLEAVLASVQGVTKAPVIITTPKGKNYFYKMVMGLKFKVIPHHVPLKEALKEKSGWLHRRYHYTVHPYYTQEWADALRAEMSEFSWAQEYEISYDQSVEGRIWPAFNKAHVYSESEWDKAKENILARSRIVAGWDFATSLENATCALEAAIYQPEDGAPKVLVLLDYRSWLRAEVNHVVKEYREFLGEYKVADHWGDVAGGAHDSTQKSWISNLADRGIIIKKTTAARKGLEIQDKILHLIQQGRLYVAYPASILDKGSPGPSVEDVLFQYRMGKDGSPLKDEYSHLADALQYIVLREFMEKEPIKTRRMKYTPPRQ